MDDLNVEAVARKAMLAGAPDPLPAAPAPAPPVPDPPKQPEIPKPAAVAPPAQPAASRAAPAAIAVPNVELPSVKQVVGHTAFRLGLVYVVACIMLISINPPFVQVRAKKKRNVVEAAPCSYSRVMVAAAVITSVVGVAPIAIEHRNAIAKTLCRVQAMVKLP
jgi:hypothetical protein